MAGGAFRGKSPTNPKRRRGVTRAVHGLSSNHARVARFFAALVESHFHPSFLRSKSMKAKHALIGLAIVIPSFIAGAMLNELAFGQDKKASPSEWKYKVVDLMFQKPEDGSEPLATLGFDLDVQKVQK